VSTVPTRNAEKAVIRVLDTQGAGTLVETGIVDSEIQRIRAALSNRDGIVVVTGPTGSGKTTTLYGALREIATPDVNIMTVEDPVEYELPGLTQIQVEHKQGMTFASALRAILRQDPDIIFVGEIRDGETADIAAQASLTGHLVLATLHTNDAVGSIRRFIDLGLDAGTIGETLRGALAQRLVRRVCEGCAEEVGNELTPTEQALVERYGRRPKVRAKGCDRCLGSGYLGRLPVTEFMVPTPDLVRLIMDDAPPFELQRQATADGMTTLAGSALSRMETGQTTIEEVDRVIGLGDGGQGTGPADTDDLETAELPPPPERRASVVNTDAAIADAAAIVEQGTSGNGAIAGAEGNGTETPHVLLVDDDGTTRSIARGILEKKLGYEVTESPDGSDAILRLARGESYSLMLLDLDMPRLGGRDVLKSVRQSLATAALPVVVLTGTPDPDSEIELMEMGADDYLRKPIDPPRLQTRVKAALRRAQG
ncbi:MAG: Flp pilus assembly complex ATPase component TadA, partial [Gemmatimonadetes bacterium]|nr:Flp pilus assembly complex ATPase component TadA [Gemmatimonadota bacterium]